MKGRIEYLDGHRGLAIILVTGFHAYSRWPEIVPYGDKFAEIVPFNDGWLGVQLFFLISGFVILMTLEKCSGPKEFIFRRWLRLFPAMLICSLLIFATSGYFSERPAGVPSYSSLLPGLSFIQPTWWKNIVGFPQNELEGAFWSLYVEVKFYMFAALVYFWKGSKQLVCSLAAVYSLAVFVGIFNARVSNEYLAAISIALDNLSFIYFGWFAAGSSFYIYYKTKDHKWLFAALCIALISSVFAHGLNWKSSFAAASISAFFALSVINKKLQYLLSRRFFLTLGFISYPFYLIHENMMISMIVKLGKSYSNMPQFVLPILPVIVLSLIAYFIAAYGEVLFRQLIMASGKKLGWEHTKST